MSNRKALVRLALSFCVGGVFVYAGIVKAIDPLHFANEIENYRLLSWPLAMGAALFLPWLEIFCGLALVVGRLRSGGVVILTLAMTFFLVLTVTTRMRGINLDCGCFGSAGKGLGFAAHLALDCALLLALGLLWFLPAQTLSVDK